MGRPKALLPIDGQTFVDRLITVFSSACDAVIVVLGHGAEAIQQGMQRSANIVVNPDPARGQLSSMQCGLRAMPPGTDAFLFTPVDYPAIEQDTVSLLIAAAGRNPDCPLVIPRFEGRRGHPVLCRSTLSADFLVLDAHAQAREVVHRYLDQALYVDVADAGTVGDIDDPAAYERFLATRI
jgi:molybdenum cofactor cytidylyltransferase